MSRGTYPSAAERPDDDTHNRTKQQETPAPPQQPPRPDKSHLPITPGTEAAIPRLRTKYILTTKPANKATEAADEKQPTNTTAHQGQINPLHIDDPRNTKPAPRNTEP